MTFYLIVGATFVIGFFLGRIVEQRRQRRMYAPAIDLAYGGYRGDDADLRQAIYRLAPRKDAR